MVLWVDVEVVLADPLGAYVFFVFRFDVAVSAILVRQLSDATFLLGSSQLLPFYWHLALARVHLRLVVPEAVEPRPTAALSVLFSLHFYR